MNHHPIARPVTRRSALAGLGASGFGLALAATAQRATAQDATSAALVGHPLVGTWHLTLPGPTGAPFRALYSYTSDGIVTQLAPGPTNGMGAWEATGPRTGVLTVYIPSVSADHPTWSHRSGSLGTWSRSTQQGTHTPARESSSSERSTGRGSKARTGPSRSTAYGSSWRR